MGFPSDLEIARGVKPKPIGEVAAALGFHDDEVEPYGRTKAKLSIFSSAFTQNDFCFFHMNSKKNGRWRPSPILLNLIVLQKFHFSNQSKLVESLLLCS